MSSAPKQRQTREDRLFILKTLSPGVQRIQVLSGGRQIYKKPSDVDVDSDEILLSSSGSPIVMRGKPGRKSKSALTAVTPQIAEIEQARTEHLAVDSLRKATRKDASGDAVFDAIIAAMAEEAASLDFDKSEAARHGGDTSSLSSKRARVLKGMADSWLRRKSQIEGGVIDLDSPAFQALFGLILETFKSSMLDAGSRAEFVETVFSKLVSQLGEVSWRQEAKARMKDKL
jgi:hypothetical protein